MSDNPGSTQRIVIVGGGVSGLSIAARLAQAGLPVTLLEASQFGHAASTRNQGWLHSGAWFAREHPSLAHRCHAALQQTLKFCPDCLEPQHVGMAYLVSGPDTLAADWTGAWQAAGLPFDEIERRELFAALPGLAPDRVQHAFLLPDRAFRPDVLVTHLAAAAENAGAELRSDTSVARIEHDGRRVGGVVTGTGESIPARFVVLAGGAAGLTLYEELTEHDPGRQTDYTLVPLKSHLAAVTPELGRLPFCVVDLQGFNHVPHERKSVFGTNRWQPVSTASDQQADAGELATLWERLELFFPEFDRDAHEVIEWAGTSIQAMHVDQVEPGHAPLPTVIDHKFESPALENLLSVFPGRATLWAEVAEQTRKIVLDRLAHAAPESARPPWSP